MHIYDTKQHGSMAASMHLWHSMAQHSTAQHGTAQHSTAQHSTAQHSTAQHSAFALFFHVHTNLFTFKQWLGKPCFALCTECELLSFLLCTCLLVSRVSFPLFTCFCFEKTEVLF